MLPANVAIQVETCPDLQPVLADTVQMQQVLMNLCVNGAHAIGSRDGVVRIAVGVREFPAAGDATSSAGIPPGRYVRLAVTDSGCGMDEATLARIFDPYFTTKEEGHGTGLGLAVVRGIVAEHAGVVCVESKVGIGTTFEILLPVTTVEAAPVGLPEHPVVRGEGQRLLVVDDELAVVEVARLALTRVGYLVETRTSPVEAWRTLAAAPGQFDLLLVDQQMPEMPGTELIRRVRAVAASIPVVMMSGQFEHINTDGIRPFGRISLLEKPFDIGVLANTVETALRNHGATERRAG